MKSLKKGQQLKVGSTNYSSCVVALQAYSNFLTTPSLTATQVRRNCISYCICQSILHPLLDNITCTSPTWMSNPPYSQKSFNSLLEAFAYSNIFVYNKKKTLNQNIAFRLQQHYRHFLLQQADHDEKKKKK